MNRRRGTHADLSRVRPFAAFLFNIVLPFGVSHRHWRWLTCFNVAILPWIVGAITHFIPVLTRSGGAHRTIQALLVSASDCRTACLLPFSAGSQGCCTRPPTHCYWLVSRLCRLDGPALRGARQARILAGVTLQPWPA